MSRFAAPVVFLLAGFLLAGLAACDSSGSGGDEDPPPPSEEDTTAPAAPTGLAGTSEEGAVALEWSAPSAEDLNGHRVYRSESSFSGTGAATLVSEGSLVSGETYGDESAENGTTYFYRVAAVDEAGNESSLSGMVEKTPFPNPPDKP